MEIAKSSKSPKISIIMPAYNTAPLIASSLDSVFAQTFQDFEVIVINDGSPDTVELEKTLQPYSDRIVYIQQTNKRAAGARNTAIRNMRGEFLALLDSDDIWLPDHLASQMELLASDPALDMVYSNALLLGDPKRREFMEVCPSKGTVSFEALILEHCQVSASTVVARKSTLLNAGLFDENLMRCDDYDLWVRVAFHGAKIGYNRKVQAQLNGGRPGSLGQSRAKMAEAYWTILEKTAHTLPLNDSQWKLVRGRANDIRARYLVEDGKVHLCEGRVEQARELFREANTHWRKPKLRLAVFGLDVAPKTTSKLFFLLTRIRSGAALAS